MAVEVVKEERRHYYLVSYTIKESLAYGLKEINGFMDVSFNGRKIFGLKTINHAKDLCAKKWSVHKDKVIIIAISYLGEMTKEEWENS